jgi:hypothetical protein
MDLSPIGIETVADRTLVVIVSRPNEQADIRANDCVIVHERPPREGELVVTGNGEDIEVRRFTAIEGERDEKEPPKLLGVAAGLIRKM